MFMDPDTDTIRSAAADPAGVLMNVPPAGAAAPVPAVRGGIVSRRALFERLGRAGRITQVSAPAGSGKTFWLRSWIGAAGLAESTAWVPVHREERNPQRFWVSVLGALQQTAAGSTVVRPLTAAPDLDGWAVVERLLASPDLMQGDAEQRLIGPTIRTDSLAAAITAVALKTPLVLHDGSLRAALTEIASLSDASGTTLGSHSICMGHPRRNSHLRSR
jgi:hypothetical protein